MVASAGAVDSVPPDQSSKEYFDFGPFAQCATSGGGHGAAPPQVSSKVDQTLEIVTRVIGCGSAVAPDDGDDANNACDALFAAGVSSGTTA